MNPLNNTEMLQKQMESIKKSNNVTLPEDDGRAFMEDVVASGETLKKLNYHPAKSSTGKIEMLGVKKRRLKEHKGINTTPDGTDHKEERSVPFALTPVYTDAWFENSNVYYTARSRGQNVEDILARMIQDQFSADLQDLAFNGDKSSSDEFIKLDDGFLKLAKTNVDTIKHDVTGDIEIADLQTVPVKVAPEQLRVGTYVWVMGKGTHTRLQAEVIARPTALGDAVLVNGVLTRLHGYDIELVDHIVDDAVLFTPLENLTVATGFDVEYSRTGEGPEAVAKQATYHFVLSSVDFIIRTPKALVYIGADAVTP